MNKPLEQAEFEYIIARVIKNELLFREQNLRDYGYEKYWEKNLML